MITQSRSAGPTPRRHPGSGCAEPLVGSVAELIEIAAAAGGARGRARVALKLDAARVGDGCPPETWPLLLAIASRLTRAQRIEVTELRPHLAEHTPAGDPVATELQRALVQAQRLGIGPRDRVPTMA